jgi:hypothetical protein
MIRPLPTDSVRAEAATALLSAVAGNKVTRLTLLVEAVSPYAAASGANSLGPSLG